MAKETVILRSGEQLQRVVRDIDFMMLCDGQQYARCTSHNGQEIEISRKRDANGNVTSEWQENSSTTIGIIVLESTESDVNTEEITIQVKCTSCDEVKPATICVESLADYTLNEDGETYTSLYEECAGCLTGESDEDRLERQAQAHLEAAAFHRDDPLF